MPFRFPHVSEILNKLISNNNSETQGRWNRVCRVCSCTPTFLLLPLVNNQVLYERIWDYLINCTPTFYYLPPPLKQKWLNRKSWKKNAFKEILQLNFQALGNIQKILDFIITIRFYFLKFWRFQKNPDES